MAPPLRPTPPLSRRHLLLLAASACLCGCDAASTDPPLVAEYPYNGPEEPPHHVPQNFVDPKTIVVPPAPKNPIATDIGPVLPRSAWTTASPDLPRMRPMNGVQLITFHHSGDGRPFLAASATDVARHLETVRQFHRQRGMSDIGYHFAIDRAGRVWQLRPLKYEGQHVRIGTSGKRWNEHNLGIVILGDFSKQDLSAEQKKAIVTFGTFLRKKYNLPAAAIHTHQELVQTDCPGKLLQPYIAQIRKQGLL